MYKNEGVAMKYDDNLSKFIDETIKESASLSTDLKNLNARFDEHKIETDKNFDKIDTKLDSISKQMTDGLHKIDLTQQSQDNRIKVVEDKNNESDSKASKKIDWLMALLIAIASPLVIELLHYLHLTK